MSGPSRDRATSAGVRAWTRALVSFAAGAAATAVLTAFSSWQLAALAGWIVAAVMFVGWVWLDVRGLDGAATAEHAGLEDSSRPASELVVLSASTASLIAVAFAVIAASEQAGDKKVLLTLIAAATVVVSWAAVHTVFVLRYARLYYAQGGGIRFEDTSQPDYSDFAYVAFTIGMTYQVSDTALTSTVIRRTALRHGLLSFVFGTSILAMLINVVAGLFRT